MKLGSLVEAVAGHEALSEGASAGGGGGEGAEAEVGGGRVGVGGGGGCSGGGVRTAVYLSIRSSRIASFAV